MKKVYFERNKQNKERESNFATNDIVRISTEFLRDTKLDKKSTKQYFSYSLFQIKKENKNYSWDVILYESKIDARDKFDQRIRAFINNNNLQVPEKYFRKINVVKLKRFSKDWDKNKVPIDGQNNIYRNEIIRRS